MIKFFRKIRQKLLAENKISKYLLYAVGEIILVVIGILIALQINNWNEINKTHIIEINTLKELRSDLEQNRIEINGHITALENCVKSNKVILHYMENKLPYNDSLDFHFSTLYPFIAFAPVQTTFDNLSQNGIKLISNDSLRNQISKLYGNEFEAFRVFERTYFVEHYSNYIKPMFIKEFETFEVFQSVKPKNYEQFILNQEYKQVLNFTVNNSQTFIAMQSRYIEIVDSLIINIDNEIAD
ncbi:DUF6090 family protein [Gaetbulibacter aquiaggeris]|uniref:DUF6090 family protein n=1 Tax=Gaetbulibacter aquiaggeris TaxID=1735373 RepID=A0ABW7MQ89_9FLAO